MYGEQVKNKGLFLKTLSLINSSQCTTTDDAFKDRESVKQAV